MQLRGRMPDGYYRTRQGYRRSYRTGRMEHVEVWEAHHGRRVPDGHDIHHVDGDKLNNDPSNLLAVTRLEHKRIHSGCELRGGEWWKPCHGCGEFKPIGAEYWYMRGDSPPSECKVCTVRRVVRDKRLRKLRRASKT